MLVCRSKIVEKYLLFWSVTSRFLRKKKTIIGKPKIYYRIYPFHHGVTEFDGMILDWVRAGQR